MKPYKKQECPISTSTFYEHFTDINSIIDTNLGFENTVSLYDKPIECLDEDFTTLEIENAIKKLKLNKSPGYDNILNECLIYGKDMLFNTIKLIFQHLFTISYFPNQWSEGIIIPIYKKGDKTLPSNYRAITLLSCIGKLFTSILCTRITSWATVNLVFSEAQFGFRPTYNTVDAIFTLYVLISSIKRSNKLHCAFIDISTAF